MILPEWVLIVAAIGSPLVALVGIVLGQLHIGAKVQGVKTEFNSKMDRLLDLTAKAARAEGVIEGKALAEAVANAIAAQALHDTALRAEGAAALLVLQTHPPEELPPEPTAPPEERP